MKNGFLLSLALMALGLSSAAWADSSVTRTLKKSPAVPVGVQVSVENLVGHMTVSQGPDFQVTATVVADGDQAQALAQSVKLDVSTSGNAVTVHVHYPVNKYDSYLYAAGDKNNEVCVLGIICFRGGSNSGLAYQGERVRVYRGGREGTPLHVNVAVQIPAGMRARLANAVGLLEAGNLTNSLTLDAQGGNVYAYNLTGDLTTNTRGGDLRVQGLKGKLQAGTGGGDVYLSHGSGDMDLRTGGGDGHIGQITGSLDAHTGGGDLHVTGYTGGSKLSLHTGGGDLRFAGDLAATRELDIGTGGGDSVLKISQLSMHLDVSSGGGDISVHLPEATNVESRDYRYAAEVGKAQGQGRISSGGGDVTVSGQ